MNLLTENGLVKKAFATIRNKLPMMNVVNKNDGNDSANSPAVNNGNIQSLVTSKFNDQQQQCKIINVDSTNLSIVVPHLEKQIEDADFISFDTEFLSSLKNDSFLNNSDRYESFSKIVESGILFQTGMSLFKRSHDSTKKHSFDINSYCFNLLPDKYISKPLSISIESLKFLASVGYNFENMFENPIFLKTKNEFDTASSRIDKNYAKKWTLAQKSCKVKASDVTIKDEFKETCSQIESFMNDVNSQKSLSINYSQKGLSKFLENYLLTKYRYDLFTRFQLPPVLTADKVDEEQRDVRKSKFSMLLTKCKDNKEWRDLCIEAAKCEKEEFLIKVQLSTLVLKAMSTKPIIVHNGILDLMFMISTFSNNLPRDLKGFKNSFNFRPCIFDTKHLAKNVDLPFELNRTDLTNLHDTLSENLQEGCDVEFNSLQSDDQLSCLSGNEMILHNAGYDSLLTGKIFVYLDQYFKNSLLSNLKKSPHKNIIYAKSLRGTQLKLNGADHHQGNAEEQYLIFTDINDDDNLEYTIRKNFKVSRLYPNSLLLTIDSKDQGSVEYYSKLAAELGLKPVSLDQYIKDKQNSLPKANVMKKKKENKAAGV